MSPPPSPPVEPPAAGSLGRSFAVLSAGQIVSRLLAFGVAVHLTRVLQADGFGAVTFATSVLVYAALMVDLGFDGLGPLELARARIPIRALVGTVVTVRLLMTSVAFAALALFVSRAPVSASTRAILLLYGLSLVASALDLNWVFLGTADMKPAAVAEILTQGLLAIGVVVLVAEPAHAVRVPLLFLASRFVAVGSLWWVFVRRFGFGLRFDRAHVGTLVRAALPLTGSAAVGTFHHNFDLVILGLWLGTQAAGVYGAASRIVWIPILLASAYYTALRPGLARGAVQGLAAVQAVLHRSSRIVIALGIGVATGGIVVARPLIELLFGPGYEEAAAPLRILLVGFALFAVSRQYRLVLVAFGHQKTDFAIMAVASAVNVALNVLLVRRAGLAGAALATLAAEGCILLLGYGAVRRRVGHLPFMPHVVRPVLCAAVMAAVLATPLFHIPVPLRILLGGAVFLACLLPLRVIKIEDIRAALAP